MVKPQYLFIGVALSVLGLAILYSLLFGVHTTYGMAPTGLAANAATSTQIFLPATTATLLVATTSNCASRVVSTGGSAVMLSFTDNQTPNGGFGVWQAASTSVAYDGGLFGCGLMRAWSQTLSTLTIIDVR